jgi:hypothetical protein
MTRREINGEMPAFSVKVSGATWSALIELVDQIGRLDVAT